MGRIITADDWDAWRALFDLGASAFRLETLQTYAEPDEADALDRFRAGEDPGLDTSWWEDLVTRHTEGGHTMTRVRVLVEPLSEYARFQLPYLRRFAAAGEDIRIIPTTVDSWPAGLPRHDFWLFDDVDVWILHYTDAGAFIEAERPPDGLIHAHRHWRDLALEAAVPLGKYLRTRDARRAS
jgi:hypothetical protein